MSKPMTLWPSRPLSAPRPISASSSALSNERMLAYFPRPDRPFLSPFQCPSPSFRVQTECPLPARFYFLSVFRPSRSPWHYCATIAPPLPATPALSTGECPSPHQLAFFARPYESLPLLYPAGELLSAARFLSLPWQGLSSALSASEFHYRLLSFRLTRPDLSLSSECACVLSCPDQSKVTPSSGWVPCDHSLSFRVPTGHDHQPLWRCHASGKCHVYFFCAFYTFINQCFFDNMYFLCWGTFEKWSTFLTNLKSTLASRGLMACLATFSARYFFKNISI